MAPPVPSSANVHQKSLEEIFSIGVLLASRRLGTSTAGKMPTLFGDANTMPLTDTRIRGLKPESRPKRYSDGFGLYLEVTTGGSKLWKMAYCFEGKQKTLSFGPYPEVSLGRARERRLEARTLLFEGVDPSATRKADKEMRRSEIDDTFGQIADELLAKEEIEGLAPATLKKKRWLARLASEDLVPKPIRDIKALEILATLRKVEKNGNTAKPASSETASDPAAEACKLWLERHAEHERLTSRWQQIENRLFKEHDWSRLTRVQRNRFPETHEMDDLYDRMDVLHDQNCKRLALLPTIVATTAGLCECDDCLRTMPILAAALGLRPVWPSVDQRGWIICRP